LGRLFPQGLIVHQLPSGTNSPVSPCDNNPCENNGTCSVDVNGNATCTCDGNWNGTYCQGILK
jgi:hypothetical protein